MAVYGLDYYGLSLYGIFTSLEYRVDPFTAVPSDYSSILLSWNKPSGTISGFRIVKNMYGFPVDQDDGQVILDTTQGWPGGSLSDNSVTPGAYHYYGFYCLVNTEINEWVRSGLTGCLMVSSYDSSGQMIKLVPSYYLEAVNQESELQADPTGNPYLVSFMDVLGWGMDYLRTQYDTYLNTNNPWTIPVNDLYNLAQELNLNINPDIHPYTLRKAVYYNAPVNQMRGTSQGIEMELSALTGWSADVTTGVNLMLDDDQSWFKDPVYPSWTAAQAYDINERVTYGNYIYQCLATGNKGSAPTGTTSSNTYWEAVLKVPDSTDLLNSATGNISTWEVVWPDFSNGSISMSSMTELLGIANPLNLTSFTYNGLNVVNEYGSTTDIWLRTLSRTTTDLDTVTTTFAPDNTQVIEDGIPLPSVDFLMPWKEDVIYLPQQVVTYNNQPFSALRSSFNSVPPYSSLGMSSQDWAPLSFDGRMRVCSSFYVTSNGSQECYPFIEWYDDNGNFITRVISRNPSPGVVAVPANLCYDSFVTGALASLSGRKTDDTSFTWALSTGSLNVSPYSGGCSYPQSSTTRSIATVNTGSANAQVGLTFVTSPASSWSTGLVLRHADDSHYLRADMATLKQNNGGTWTALGTYSTPCQAGDRINVTLNGSAITVYRNNISVLSVTSSFNSSSTVFGIVNELS